MERQLIFKGGIVDGKSFDIDLLVAELKARLEYAHQLSIDDIINFFDALICHWKETGLDKKYGYLKNLSDFFERGNLSKRLQIALRGDCKVIDEFVDFGDPKLLLHVQPRGLTVHWLAGNVAVLGLFSIFFALITKNVCLIKASSKGYQELIFLLNTLLEIKTEQIDGREFAKSVAVILLENNDQSAHEQLSQVADVRIAWGGFEGVGAIMGLKKNLFCEDIILGPKYSYAAIDKESLAVQKKAIAQKLAVDVSVFDQYACSSPHTVFAQENKPGEALEFARELALQLEFVSKKLLPKEEIEPGKAAEIVALRSEYELKGRVFNSAGTTWTVVYAEEPGLAQGCFSRVIFVKPIDELIGLKDFNDRQKQTLGIAFTEDNKKKYLDQITLKGIDRCPDLGYLTFYESPWDGMFVFDRLVRWVSRHK